MGSATTEVGSAVPFVRATRATLAIAIDGTTADGKGSETHVFPMADAGRERGSRCRSERHVVRSKKDKQTATNRSSHFICTTVGAMTATYTTPNMHARLRLSLRTVGRPVSRRAAWESQAARRGTPPLLHTTRSSTNDNADINADTKAAMLTDDRVPEGHRALHETLYGSSDGANKANHGSNGSNGNDTGDMTRDNPNADASITAHATRRPYQFVQGEDDGSAILPIAAFLARRKLSPDTLPPMGVFAIYDSDRTLQYVSYSRNIVLSVKSIVDSVGGVGGMEGEEGTPSRCAFVRVLVFQNRAMQTRQAMESQKQAWIEENGTVPPGNGVEKGEWGVGFAVGSMSEGEKEVYDEKKTKMVAAMGQRLDEDEKMGSREKLKTAVEGGDWSAVIDEQTRGTVGKERAKETEGTEGSERTEETEAEASSPPPAQMTTPFAQASVHRTMHEHENNVVMNVETVDKALDEVRPYLQADGGDVEVVEVENGRVLLRLQGQCSSCTASDSTMSMGIERALRANFGDQLKEVIEVGGGAASVATSLGTVNAAVGGLRGAIEAYGGTVEVDTVEPPHAVILYTGVKSLAYGLKMALMDQFKDLKQITFVDAETGDVIEF